MATEETYTEAEIDKLAEEIAEEIANDLDEAEAPKTHALKKKKVKGGVTANNDGDDDSEAEVYEEDEAEEEEEQMQTKVGKGKKKGVSIKEKKKASSKVAEEDDEADDDDDDDEDENVEESVDFTKMQKQEMIRNIFAQMQKTRKGKLTDSYEKLMGMLVTETETDDDEDSVEEQETQQVVSRHRIRKEDIDVSDDIGAIFGSSEDLSEDFKSQVTTIFETAVIAKVNSELDLMEATYSNRLETDKEEILGEMTEKIDTYLAYVVEEWVKENELAIEAGLKSEITEDFIGGLKRLFEEHYVELPDDKVDVVETLASQVEKLESKLNESIEKNVELTSQVSSLTKESILDEQAEGLTDIQSEKLRSLAENVDFEDESQFREQIGTIKESYFSSNEGQKKTPKVDLVDSEIVEEDGNQSVSPRMAAYTNVIRKTVENY